MLTVYGIKSCDTCRRAKKFLEERNIEFNFHDLRDEGLDIQMLERWSARIDWERLLNRKSLTWRKLPEADRTDITKERAFATMLDQPTGPGGGLQLHPGPPLRIGPRCWTSRRS